MCIRDRDQVELIRRQVGDKKVLLALSGGVDSSVVAAMLIKAIGQQLVCVHVCLLYTSTSAAARQCALWKVMKESISEVSQGM